MVGAVQLGAIAEAYATTSANSSTIAVASVAATASSAGTSRAVSIDFLNAGPVAAPMHPLALRLHNQH